ncbi:MAG: hypothetical protein AB1782_20320 [Cyanobacteriota bacterium]
MKNIQKLLVSFLFLILVFSTNSLYANAETKQSSYSQLPNSQNLINLNVKNKSLSYTLRKLANKARINIVISPEFNDGNISINLHKTKVEDAIKTLMDVGNFTIEQDNNLIIVSNKIEPEVATELIPLENSQASKIAYMLSKTISIDGYNNLSYDDISNSLIIQGDDKFIYSVKSVLDKIDLPKKHSSFELKNSTASQVKEMLNKVVFNNNENQNITIDNKTLMPVFDEELGFVIKGMIQKTDTMGIKAENPLIIAEDKNQITIIGNSHQIGLAKSVIEYLEGKLVDKDEEIRLTHSKIYDAKQEINQLKDKLKESQLHLSDAILDQVEKNIEINKLNKIKDNLNQEITRLNAKKMWNIVLDDSVKDPNSTDQSEQINTLESEISLLKDSLTETKNLLSEKTDYSNKLEKQLALKDKEIELANAQLNQLQTQLDTLGKAKFLKDDVVSIQKYTELEKKLSSKDRELEIAYRELETLRTQIAEFEVKNSLQAPQAVNSESSGLLATAMADLNNTKTELNKVKKQLDASKKQLELIFGGKLLDESTLPNDKSVWFK